MDDYRGKNKIYLFFVLTLMLEPALCIQSRSVNLALETSFLFDPQDIKENATFINKVQSVLDKLKTVLEPSETFRAKDKSENGEKVILTRFLSQIGSSLIKFDNEDIKKITSDLRDAVYKHANKTAEFNDLFEDERLRAFVKNTVRIWAETDPMILKVEIAKYITSVDTDNVIELFKIFNKVFDNSDEPKFKKLTKKFNKAVKNKDFRKFLAKTIDFVVFKRYKKLNFLLKHIIKDELKKFTDYISAEYNGRLVAVKDDRRFSLSDVVREERVATEKESSDSIEAMKMKSVVASEEKKDFVIDKDLNLNVNNDKNGLTMTNSRK